MIDITEKLIKIADASRRADGSDIPLGEQCREAAAEISSLRKRVVDLEGAGNAVISHRVGELPRCGFIRDNDASREVIGRFVATLKGEPNA